MDNNIKVKTMLHKLKYLTMLQQMRKIKKELATRQSQTSSKMN